MRVGYLLGLGLAVGAVQAAEPVASVRVAFDRGGVTAAHAQGMADISVGRAVSADDPVRIASISKLVTAIGVMRMVEAGLWEVTLTSVNVPDRSATLTQARSGASVAPRIRPGRSKA